MILICLTGLVHLLESIFHDGQLMFYMDYVVHCPVSGRYAVAATKGFQEAIVFRSLCEILAAEFGICYT